MCEMVTSLLLKALSLHYNAIINMLNDKCNSAITNARTIMQTTVCM